MNNSNIIKLILAKPRGFCAGVIRADKILKKLLKLYGSKERIYVRKQIVHNKFIIDFFTKQGIIFVDDVDEVPEGSIVVYSAHGVSPYVRLKSKQKGLRDIDATCPFVENVHNSCIEYAKKLYHIFFIGHKNHEETIGTTEESIFIQKELRTKGKQAGNTYIISDEDSIDNISISDKSMIACFTQTTLNIDDTKEIINKLKSKYGKNIIFPKGDNICYATKHRQDALKNIIKKSGCNPVLIVGSQNSSNSKRLVETAKKMGVEAYLIDSYRDINEEWFNNTDIIGISSGASVPEYLIDELIEYFNKLYDKVECEDSILIEEKVNLPLPQL